MRPVIYLAMPYRSRSRFRLLRRLQTWLNVRHAARIAARLTGLGYAVVCPHTNSHLVSQMPGAPSSENSEWLEIDKAILARCDAIYLGPGWSASEGACAELAFALQQKIVVWREMPSRGRLDDLIGAGRSLWTNNADFEAFLTACKGQERE